MNAEQEKLIDELTELNQTRNAQFRIALLTLPGVSFLPYLPALFRQHTFLPSILALTSLASTTYLLLRLPPGVTGISFLDRLSQPKTPPPNRNPEILEDYDNTGPSMSMRSRRRSAAAFGGSQGARPFAVSDPRSPLETYLPYLNAGLYLVLALLGLSAKLGPVFGGVGLGNLPGIVLLVVVVAKMVMGTVDPEKELAALKYEFKGA